MHLQSLNRDERLILGQAINKARDAWGRPHLHAGAGIRKLDPEHFECRSGLELRFVFKDLGADGLYFVFMGSHNQVRHFIKSAK
jgi:hypothetical protein